MLRVISELRPAWVVGENVAGIVNMALDQVYADLENEGYSVQSLIIPACAVDAPHRRDRCAIVAWDANRRDRDAWAEREVEERENAEPAGICDDVPYPESNGLQGQWASRKQVCGTRSQKREFERNCDVFGTGERRTAQPGLGGVADGISDWMDRNMSVPGYWMPEPDIPRITTKKEYRKDRLQCLGNAVVPQQFYPIFQAISDIERGVVHG